MRFPLTFPSFRGLVAAPSSVLGLLVFGLTSPLTSYSSPSHSDGEKTDIVATGSAIVPMHPDPAISAALSQVSPARMRQTVEALVGFGNRNTLSSMDKDLPPGKGVTAAAQWIQGQYAEISKQCDNCLEVKTDTFIEPPQTGTNPRITQPTTITNVYAILRGTVPAQAARMYLVTGHYDSRRSDTMDTHGDAPGANDDASGVAVSLECARVLSKLRFPATIVFATVAGEEQGLNGSAHLAKLAKSEGWQLAGVLNNDIVGGDTTPGDARLENKSRVRVFSEGMPYTATADEVKRLLSLGLDSDSPSRELARAIVDVDSTYFNGHAVENRAAAAAAFRPVMVMRLDRYLRGGDHSSFNQQGFAAVRFTEWRENFAHQHQDVRMENGVQYGDLIQFDDFAYMANVARLNAAALATLASAPGAPQNVRVDTQALDNNSDLLWQAPEGAPASTRYEVLWRETSAPMWQYFLRPAPTTATVGTSDQITYRATVPVSKDNVIFGIRACDDAGHCSPAVTPIPLPRRH
jgi:hypothetical protein